jgi:ketose-bisphosphate aldolase
MPTSGDFIRNAYHAGIAVLAFNVPYLPMVEPVIRAVADQDAFALIETARLEWIKFAAGGPEAVLAEFQQWQRPDHVRLHLDHVPVIDEDGLSVDYRGIITQALVLGYQSVMIDGSRLVLPANIAATREIVQIAHGAGVPCEAELGAVLGHESGPLPSYAELFASGRGFTRVDEAVRFVRETGCDWLSVAIGNIHGAISGAAKSQKKVEARLNLDHLRTLRQALDLPLVLHGGSGVRREDVLAAMKIGIAKINVGSEIRQAYEVAIQDEGDVREAQDVVYARTVWLLRDYFGVSGCRAAITG